MSQADRDRMAQNGLQVAYHQYDREILVRQIEAVLLSVVLQGQQVQTQPS
jgi:hypothetical protein